MILAPTRYVPPARPLAEPDVACTCGARTKEGTGRHAEHCVMVLRWARFDAVIAAAQARLEQHRGGR